MRVAPLVLVAGLAAAGCGGGGSHEVEVASASLQPGLISLVVENGSGDAARVAQVIVNDGFVDFRSPNRVLLPDAATTLTLLYPWVEGESYDVRLLTSTGSTVDYEIEDAEES